MNSIANLYLKAGRVQLHDILEYSKSTCHIRVDARRDQNVAQGGLGVKRCVQLLSKYCGGTTAVASNNCQNVCRSRSFVYRKHTFCD